ncbi:Alpha-agarase [BD1-7 clade bacterium]|uniref:Alpha-agarase n=1 Tax=BD1-7 clade bacterium TaxID=2029982 RepID=A0A5S9PJ39_9GAMM|nr:Alpha-agarase [BD1-7 clade bacterium]CAA0104090.1 Alpha-agarase [BD1-7 clade bacterium]
MGSFSLTGKTVVALFLMAASGVALSADEFRRQTTGVSSANANSSLGTIYALSDYGAQNGLCSRDARIEIKGGDCYFNNDVNSKKITKGSGCGDAKAEATLRTKSGAKVACNIEYYADRSFSSKTWPREIIKLNQKVIWQNTGATTAMSGSNAALSAVAKTSDSVANTGVGISFSLASGSSGCSVSGTTVNFTSAGTCKVRATAGANSNLASATADRTWSVFGDADNDGKHDGEDNCPNAANSNQANNDGDSQGDVCDTDDDNDGRADTSDNCPLVSNNDQLNTDGDSQGNACDSDDDNDTVADNADNCPLVTNSNQANNDGDAQGDVCDSDDDNDSVADGSDNCQFVANTNQLDIPDNDGIGNACDTDDDGDGIANTNDNDADNDGVADADEFGGDPYADNDNDGVPAYLDDNDNNPSIGNDDGNVESEFDPRGTGTPDFLNPGADSTAITLYVDKKVGSSGNGLSWATAFKTLEEGITAAVAPGDQIWLAQGVYTPASGRFTIGQAISIYGGFFGKGTDFDGETKLSEAKLSLYPTVISGDIAGDDTNKFANGVTPTADDIQGTNTDLILLIRDTGDETVRLDKLYFSGSARTATNNHGGAIKIDTNSTVEITNVTFQGNRVSGADAIGGALMIENSNVTVSDSTFEWNKSTSGRGGAIGVSGGSTLTMDRVTVNNNVSTNSDGAKAGGGAIYAVGNGVNVFLVNSTVTANTATNNGGAFFIRDGATVNCEYCTVVNNSLLDTTSGSWERSIVLGDSGGSTGNLVLSRSLVVNDDAGSNDSSKNGRTIRTYSSSQITDNGYNRIGTDGNAGVYYAANGGNETNFAMTFNNEVASEQTSKVMPENTASKFVNTVLGSDGGMTRTLPIMESTVKKDDYPGLRDVIPAAECNMADEDQRGWHRPFGNGCDVGAFEYTDANGSCWDDGAIDRSYAGTGNNFCFSTTGGTIDNIIKNVVVGEFHLWLSLGLLGLWGFRRRL